MDKKNIIIVVLLIECAVLSYILLSKTVVFPPDEIMIKRIQVLEQDNKTLRDKVCQRDSINIVLKNHIDSLSSTEKEIQIVYKDRYEKNKNLPANALVVRFNNIFADNNIK